MPKVLNGEATFLFFTLPISIWHFWFRKQLLVDSFGLRLYLPTYPPFPQKKLSLTHTSKWRGLLEQNWQIYNSTYKQLNFKIIMDVATLVFEPDPQKFLIQNNKESMQVVFVVCRM